MLWNTCKKVYVGALNILLGDTVCCRLKVIHSPSQSIVLLTSLLRPSSDESRLLDPLLVFLFPLPLERSNLPLPPDSRSSFDDVFLNRENFLDFPTRNKREKYSVLIQMFSHSLSLSPFLIHAHNIQLSIMHHYCMHNVLETENGS